jgi:hypothetical protein
LLLTEGVLLRLQAQPAAPRPEPVHG